MDDLAAQTYRAYGLTQVNLETFRRRLSDYLVFATTALDLQCAAADLARIFTHGLEARLPETPDSSTPAGTITGPFESQGEALEALPLAELAGQRVMVKPNLGLPDPPPVTTPADDLLTAVEALYRHRAQAFMAEDAHAWIADVHLLSPAWLGPLTSMGCDFVRLRWAGWRQISLSEGATLDISCALDGVDAVVNLASWKHPRDVYHTGAAKNLISLLAPWERVRLHTTGQFPAGLTWLLRHCPRVLSVVRVSRGDDSVYYAGTNPVGLDRHIAATF